MCLRYTQRRYPTALGEELGMDVPSVLPLWNQSPGKAAMTVRSDVPSPNGGKITQGLVVDMLEWGYRETWMAQPGASIKGPLPNATAEKAVLAGSMSNEGLRCRRCVVIADGWYAWPRVGDRKRDQSRPHFLRFRDDRVFGFAGIWTRFDPEPGVQCASDTVAILTVASNPLLGSLSVERMPVVLMPSQWENWLSMKTRGKNIIDMLAPWPAKDLEAWQVGSRVNDIKYNEPGCIAPVGPVQTFEGGDGQKRRLTRIK